MTRTLHLTALCALLVACASPTPPPVVITPERIVAPATPVDPDEDGLTGDADHCPDAPEDCDGFEDADGCPDNDDDGDGVPDVCDACPRDRGAPADGCPPYRVVIEASNIQIIQSVHFDANRVALTPRDIPVLEAVAQVMRERPELRLLELQGHASPGERDPTRTSQRRADVAVAWLAAHGLDASRLVARGYGADVPLDANTTADGRARNRRVAFHILRADSPPERPQRPPRRVIPEGCPDHPPPPRRGPCTSG